ncbi:uncharacterized protein LOC117123012 isoform X2 [Anneissia japonica]|uniref:uncharacterized protein LOC117123012 isoform X2 n=1 Tax=Anneissia japonica TaxID=1529436 RepID=UPI001425836A|nr:uncharacterized protein LOC117123012 isoform X2 [Anneissia japonica]
MIHGQSFLKKKVIDNAIERLGGYWEGTKFDGFALNVSHEKSTDKFGPYEDYGEVYRLLKGSLRQLQHQREVLEELKFGCKHTKRDICETTFVKCTDNGCHHCTSNPVVAVKTIDVICQQGPMIQLTLDEYYEGHYMTFLDQLTVDKPAY